jgi:hypothetical protein
MDERYDEQKIRCPRIGGEVIFKYCRTSGEPFCHIIINCWATRMDIGSFLAENYSPEVIQKSLKPSPQSGRLARILSASKSKDEGSSQ